MAKKVNVDPALLIEHALRGETLGRGGVFYRGNIHSAAEMRKLAGVPMFPLHPFNEQMYYSMYKNGSGSSNRS